MRRYNQGWRQESERHSLARRGVKTGRKLPVMLCSFGDVKNPKINARQEYAIERIKKLLQEKVGDDREIEKFEVKVEDTTRFDMKKIEDVPATFINVTAVINVPASVRNNNYLRDTFMFSINHNGKITHAKMYDYNGDSIDYKQRLVRRYGLG